MTTEHNSELCEKLSTQSAIAEHMTKECADLREENRTLESRLAAHAARIEEISKLLHPVTTGELNDILGWVDVRLGKYEEHCPAFERGELTLQAIRTEPEKTCDDTAVNVLATALRSEMDKCRKVWSEAVAFKSCANAHALQLMSERDQYKARAEKAEAELAACVLSRNCANDNLVKLEAELAECRKALDAIANHMSMDGYGYDAWRNLALEMASVAKTAIDAARKEGV